MTCTSALQQALCSQTFPYKHMPRMKRLCDYGRALLLSHMFWGAFLMVGLPRVSSPHSVLLLALLPSTPPHLSCGEAPRLGWARGVAHREACRQGPGCGLRMMRATETQQSPGLAISPCPKMASSTPCPSCHPGFVSLWDSLCPPLGRTHTLGIFPLTPKVGPGMTMRGMRE